MDKTEFTDDWVDRYLRNELTPEQESEFEIAMLESPEIQQQLEDAMAIRQALIMDTALGATVAEPQKLSHGRWQTLAMAASLVLAVFSTTMYWKTSNELGDLHTKMSSLAKPRSGLVVPIDIMRSIGSRSPYPPIHKPTGGGEVVLDIELSKTLTDLEELHMSLVDEQGNIVDSWISPTANAERIQVIFTSSSLPSGLVWLEMSDGSGKTKDRRLLEFLP